MKNQGKIFEDNFRKSIPLDSPDIFYYRFRDGTAGWGDQQAQTRFQAKNICDNMIFYKNKLFLNELKSHKGKSLPFTCIRDNQFEELEKANQKNNVYAVIIVFFSDIEETYALNISDILALKRQNTSKSIPLLFCQQKGFKIDCERLRTNYRYNLLNFLENYNKKREL